MVESIETSTGTKIFACILFRPPVYMIAMMYIEAFKFWFLIWDCFLVQLIIDARLVVFCPSVHICISFLQYTVLCMSMTREGRYHFKKGNIDIDHEYTLQRGYFCIRLIVSFCHAHLLLATILHLVNYFVSKFSDCSEASILNSLW